MPRLFPWLVDKIDRCLPLALFDFPIPGEISLIIGESFAFDYDSPIRNRIFLEACLYVNLAIPHWRIGQLQSQVHAFVPVAVKDATQALLTQSGILLCQ
jgi:hypothetical protein